MTYVEEVEGVNLTSRFFTKRSLIGENPEVTLTLFTPSTGRCHGFTGGLQG